VSEKINDESSGALIAAHSIAIRIRIHARVGERRWWRRFRLQFFCGSGSANTRARALFPISFFPAVDAWLYCQIGNPSRPEIRIVPAENLAFPRIALFGLPEFGRVCGLPVPGPLHRKLLAERVVVHQVEQFDEFAHPHTAETRAEDGGNFPFRVIGHPVPRHEPSRSSSVLLLFHAATLSHRPSPSAFIGRRRKARSRPDYNASIAREGTSGREYSPGLQWWKLGDDSAAHMKLWADELASWRRPEAFEQAMLGLRLGALPQVVITTTPKPVKLIRELIANSGENSHKGEANAGWMRMGAPKCPECERLAKEAAAAVKLHRCGLAALQGCSFQDGYGYQFPEALRQGMQRLDVACSGTRRHRTPRRTCLHEIIDVDPTQFVLRSFVELEQRVHLSA
jgi:hypothetical protein